MRLLRVPVIILLASASVVAMPSVWTEGSLTFNWPSDAQEDCITDSTCLSRNRVLYNTVEENPQGQQLCPGYEGPANTEWAEGSIEDWATLEYEPFYEAIGCFPPGMVGDTFVVHLMSDDIYLEVTWNSWQSGGGGFSYTRTTGPGKVQPGSAPLDFDGDGKTDLSVFRPDEAEWWFFKSSDGGNGAYKFGQETDIPIPADFTGDGVTDVAFWRESTGEWFVLRSDDNGFYSFPFGTNGDVPVVGDFDGDGLADPAVFRPSTSTWFVLNSTGGTSFVSFGLSEDLPTIADFDGDGIDDIAVFRPSLGEWWQLRSADGLRAYRFGTSIDEPVVADYTGDGADDIAFWRSQSREWFVLRSEDDQFFSFPFGSPSDIPVPGDYDGDGTSDYSVFRSSDRTWYILGSTSGNAQYVFGRSTDVPLASKRNAR